MVKVYLDTSVFSAVLDDRQPGRQEATRTFWETRIMYTCVSSDVARREIEDNPDPVRRGRMLELYSKVEHIAVTRQVQQLADEYIGRGVFTAGMLDDALHVASASIAFCPVLLSWNFRHLANRRRRMSVSAVNTELGYAPMDIVSPAEV